MAEAGNAVAGTADADYSPAWYELRLAYLERCRVSETERVMDMLLRLHGRLAAALGVLP